MQWSITIPLVYITVVLLHQPPGYIQPAMELGELSAPSDYYVTE